MKNSTRCQFLRLAKKGFFIFFIMAAVSFKLAAQDKLNVTGHVGSEDQENGIPGVNILIKGTSLGTATDVNGNYNLDVPNEDAVLVFSSIGYLTEEVQVSGRSTINVNLTMDITSLQEVIVVGYGTQKKKDLTGSISSVDGKEIAKMQVPRIEQAMVGKAAGMQVTSVNSAPGAGLKIRIRGDNSLNGDNDPLVVIDGVLGGSLQALNVNDIESMQILKDASATAIYGSRGANGVIIITTKRGEPGKTQINFTTNVGFQQISKKLDLLTAEEHASLLQANPNFDFPDGVDGITNPVFTGTGTDWQDEIYQTASYQNYHISINGGSERTRYAVLGEFLDQDGVVKESGYKKGAIRFNFDHEINDKVRIGNNLNFYKTITDNVKLNEGYGSWGSPVTMAATRFSPIVPVYAEDGTLNSALTLGSTLDNPVQILQQKPDIVKRNYFLDNLFFEWDIIEGLTYKFSGTYINTSTLNPSYTSKQLIQSLNTGESGIDNRYEDDWLIEKTLTYKRVINNDHNINSVFGFTAQSFTDFRNGTSVEGFATEAMNYNNIGLAETVTNKYSSETKSNISSFLGRVSYGYKDRYLLTLSGRADGSSKFAKNNKWALFPSASVAWVLSEEQFLSDLNQLSNFKIRASYGETGNQAIGAYQSLAAFGIGNRYTIGQNTYTNAVYPQRIENADLRWETTQQLDLGVDIGFFDRRLEITADYYLKKTRDLLYNKQLPNYTGYSSQVQNIGDMQNKGWELAVNATPIARELTWNVSGNISFYDNKVTSLGEDSVIYRGDSGLAYGFRQTGALLVGQPIGNFYGYVFDGIFQDAEEVAALDQPGAKPGVVKYKDINGDGVIDATNDRVVIGNALPDFIVGFTSSVAYKGFDLNVAVQGAFGNDVAYLGRAYEGPGSTSNSTRNVLNYWTPGSGINDMQGIGESIGEMSSRIIEDGSYLRLRNISLGYTFPSTSIEKLNISNLRLYASAINWITITDYSGYDPEVNSRHSGSNFQQNIDLGFDNGAYPGVKQLIFGLNLGF